MVNFFQLSPKDKEEALRVSQADLGISESILEKDIWVSYFLDLIFNRLDLGHRFMFKGGTSLSKCYGMIHRFSEDIDLSLNMEDLGFGGANSPKETLSKSQCKKRLNELRDAGNDYTKSTLIPAIQEKLGEDSLLTEVDIVAGNVERDVSIIANYKSYCSESTYNAYFKPQIIIEPGAKAKHEPTEEIVISPLIGNCISELHSDFSVKVLDPQRTFWEKGTYIHVINNCGSPEKVKDQLSRHLYDLAMMAKHEKGKAAITNVELLAQVVEHKSLYFDSGWTDYTGAKPGSLKLVPPENLMEIFKKDYSEMAIMFYQTFPSFEELIADIEQIEATVNKL